MTIEEARVGVGAVFLSGGDGLGGGGLTDWIKNPSSNPKSLYLY